MVAERAELERLDRSLDLASWLMLIPVAIFMAGIIWIAVFCA